MYCVKEHTLLHKSSHWERIQNENTYFLTMEILTTATTKKEEIYLQQFGLNLSRLAAQNYC